MMTYRHPLWMLSGVLALTASAMRPVQAALPSGWTDADIGSPGAAGSATVDSNGVWTIMGSGGDIEGTSDSFNFAYQKVTGDATVTAHFLSMVPGDGTWTKVGPMIRVDDTDGAQNVTMDITTAVGVRIQGRDDAFANTQDNIRLPRGSGAGPPSPLARAIGEVPNRTRKRRRTNLFKKRGGQERNPCLARIPTAGRPVLT
jgi:hypothetical protein